MDLPVWILGVGTASLVVLAFRSGRRGQGPGPADLMSGLFGGPREPSWPRGVQEEDTIRPWGIPASPMADPEPPASQTTAVAEASLEDAVAPVAVTRVRPAA